jgi:hypothetical protein
MVKGMIDFQETADRLSLRFPGLKFQADLENSDIVVGQDIAELLGVELSVYIRLATNGGRWFSYHSLVNQRGDDITRLNLRIGLRRSQHGMGIID